MKIGFIGCGNMAGAIIGGILKDGLCKAAEITASNSSQSSCEKNYEKYGITMTTDNKEVVHQSEMVVLSVKPQYFEAVIEEIKGEVTEEQIIISIAPGKSLAWLEEKFGKQLKLVRCMPNTPALVGEGMTGVCCNELVQDDEMEDVMKLLNSFGMARRVAENQMDAVVGVSGSSPAYVFMMIEAMADAAVEAGLPRARAYEFAAQAVYGSAKMVLETGRHPAELKDMVCSPAGTTIEAVRILEDRGFRSALIEAIRTCVDKSRNM